MDPCAKVKGLITELISPVRVRFNRVASENVFQPLHPETGASLHVKRVIAAADLMCVLSSASEMSLLNVVTCDTSCCMLVSTGAPLHEKLVFAVRQEFNVHFEFYLRNVTGGMRTPWKLLVLVSQSVQEAVRLRKAREHNAPSLIVLGPLIVTEDVGHEALWLALVNEVRQPGAHALNCSVTDSARMCSECTQAFSYQRCGLW